MGQAAQEAVELRDFPGMMSNADPLDFPLGAAEEQVNITCVKDGSMSVRDGLRLVIFEVD